MTTVPLTAEPETDIEVPATPVRISEETRRRLAPPMPNDRWFAWIATILITVIAGVLRLIGLAHPQPAATQDKIFDEIYYATEGHDMITHGVEWNATTNSGDFVVHPPLGKWIIGLGEEIFGYNTFGWRIMPLIFGTLAILLLIRITRRMFRSTILGCAAGLLMTFDGMEFVLSRTALLDIFLMFFILAAFGCLVLDRDQRRRQWLTAMENGLDPSVRGKAGRLPVRVPWWRIAGAVMTGCAMSVKWSAIWYILLFAVLIYLWEVGARRSAGARYPWMDAFVGEIGWIVLFGLVIVAVYLASWTGWFVTDHGYYRHYLASTGHHEYPIVGPLWNLWKYHQAALAFHDGLVTPHRYQSWPWQWLLLGRPVAFWYSSTGGCGSPNCSAEVLLIGTPALWWSFLPAILAVGALGIGRRDWRANAIFWCAAAGIVPWFIWELSDRTMFFFYALPSLPFLVMGIVYVFGMVMHTPSPAGPGTPSIRAGRTHILGVERKTLGAVMLGVYVLIIVACFAYFYPILVGEKITYTAWYARMWLGGRWI